MHDWTFIPASVLSLGKKAVLQHGTHGIHYAYGWKGLADMYDVYGEHHAPTLEMMSNNGGSAANNRSTTADSLRRVSISPAQQQQDEEEVEEDKETVAFTQECDGQRGGQQDEDGTVVKLEDDEQQVVMNDEEDTAPQEATSKAAATSNTTHHSTAAVANILAAIKECNEQIAWITADNPEEQSQEEAESQKKQLRRTKQNLYSQLEAYNNEVQTFL